MASSPMPTQPAASKQLGELLQEQQEPFTLEIFLLERGYLRNNLKKSPSWGQNKRRQMIPSCSKIAKAVFNKLLSIKNSQKAKNSVSRDSNSSVWEISRSSNQQETVESDKFSSASSPTVFHSCSGSDTEDRHSSLEADSLSAFEIGNLLEEKEIVADRKLQGKCEENKELSPVSVLEEIPSNEDSPVQNNRQRDVKTRESIQEVPLGKYNFQSSVNDKPNCNDPSSQYSTAKRALQQSKQLLFDCVRELVETRGSNNGKGKQVLEFLGPEELGKLLCEDTRIWSKLSGNETNTTKLLNSAFAVSVEERNAFETQVRGIGAEIGDAILEDISKEIVVDMIGTC